MGDVEAVIAKCVDDIWAQYDKDGNGHLDKTEAKGFIEETLKSMGDGASFTEEDFNACFAEFDKDNSGTIEKTEMAVFIKKVAGL